MKIRNAPFAMQKYGNHILHCTGSVSIQNFSSSSPTSSVVVVVEVGVILRYHTFFHETCDLKKKKKNF